MSDTIPAAPRERYIQQPDVLFTEFDETESVLLALGAQRYYTLNESGICIWKALQAGATPGQVARALQSRFDVGPGEALACARAFLDELLQEELVQERPHPEQAT